LLIEAGASDPKRQMIEILLHGGPAVIDGDSIAEAYAGGSQTSVDLDRACAELPDFIVTASSSKESANFRSLNGGGPEVQKVKETVGALYKRVWTSSWPPGIGLAILLLARAGSDLSECLPPLNIPSSHTPGRSGSLPVSKAVLRPIPPGLRSIQRLLLAARARRPRGDFDVAGYSLLMGADEEGTHLYLTAHGQLVYPKINTHVAVSSRLPGTSLLAEFPSVLGRAVCCSA